MAETDGSNGRPRRSANVRLPDSVSLQSHPHPHYHHHLPHDATTSPLPQSHYKSSARYSLPQCMFHLPHSTSTNTKSRSNIGFEWGSLHARTSPRKSSHFPRALSNAAHNFSRITCMGHWAGINPVREIQEWAWIRCSVFFSGWLVAMYTFAMHRVEFSTANLLSTMSSTTFSMPSSICMPIMFATTRQHTCEDSERLGKDEELLRAWSWRRDFGKIRVLLWLWTTGSRLSLAGASFRWHNCSAMNKSEDLRVFMEGGSRMGMRLMEGLRAKVKKLWK